MKKWFSPFLIFLSTGLVANPHNPIVQLGSATVSGTNSLKVTATTDLTIINWDSFSIGTNETTTFFLPSSSSLIVNRVTGSSQSQFMTNSNLFASQGSVWLINPNGMLFSENSNVNCGSVLFTTFNNITNSDIQSYYTSGTLDFVGSNSGTFTNHGLITATHGDIVILSYQVTNGPFSIGSDQGEITANGVAAVGAGTNGTVFRLSQANDERISIVTTANHLQPITGINNTGTINGIRDVILADGTAYSLAINHGGDLGVTGCSTADGRILLIAKGGGEIDISGDMGLSACVGGDGPDIGVYATTIKIIDDANINASGDTKGGEIVLGTDGLDNRGIRCDYFSLDSGATVQSNATNEGNGGLVMAYASQSLDAQGSFISQGAGSLSEGGVIILNGPTSLTVQGTFNNTSLGGGTTGTTLLATNAPFYLGGTSSSTSSYITQPSTQNNLDTTNFILISNENQIETQSNISWSSGNTLTLLADTTIQINHLIAYNNSAVAPTVNKLIMTAENVYIGDPSRNQTTVAGINMASGAMTINATNLFGVYGGNANNIYAYLHLPKGDLTVNGGGMQIFGGQKNGTYAEVTNGIGTIDLNLSDDLKIIGSDAMNGYAKLGTTSILNIDGISSIDYGDIYVTAGICSKAYIDGTNGTINIGQSNSSTRPSNIILTGGSCGTNNYAYIGSQTTTSINSDIRGSYILKAGDDGYSNYAAIMALNNGGMATGTDFVINGDGSMQLLAGGISSSIGDNNRAFIANLTDGSTLSVNTHDTIALNAGQGAVTTATAYLAADAVTVVTAKDLILKGGNSVASASFIEAEDLVSITVGRNLDLIGGTELETTALIFCNPDVTAATIMIQNSGGQGGNLNMVASNQISGNAPVSIEIRGSGDISLGSSTAPFKNIYLTAGNGSSGYARAFIEGAGDISVVANENIRLKGGEGVASSYARFQTDGGGDINIVGDNLSLIGGGNGISDASIFAAGTGGDFVIALKGDLLLQGGAIGDSSDQVQAEIRTVDGDITILTGKNTSLLGGAGDNGYAQIFSDNGNAILLNVKKNLSLISGTGNGSGASIYNPSGSIIPKVGGNLTLEGDYNQGGNTITWAFIRSEDTVGLINVDVDGAIFMNKYGYLHLPENTTGILTVRGGHGVTLNNYSYIQNETLNKPIIIGTDDCKCNCNQNSLCKNAVCLDATSFLKTNNGLIEVSTRYPTDSSIPVGRGPICLCADVQICTGAPGYNYQDSDFLYELYYRLNYFGIFDYYDFTAEGFWHSTDWIAP